MRKLLAVLVSALMLGTIVVPGAGAIMAQAQTDTPVVAALSSDYVVDESRRESMRISRDYARSESKIASSKDAVVRFERENALVVKQAPRPKPKNNVVHKPKPKATQKVLTVSKPKVEKPRTEKTAVPANLSRGERVIRIAKQYYGIYYVWGGTTTAGFDCSGFTRFIYRKVGVELPRVSRDQYRFTKKISRSEARPGDLVFMKTNGVVTHVGIYAGGNMMIDSPRRGKTTGMHQIWGTPYFGRVP